MTDKQKASTFHVEERQGSASALSTAHLKAVDFKSQRRPVSAATTTPAPLTSSSALYRVAKTQGQASRDVARGQSRGTANQYSMNSGERAGPSKDTYASSHGRQSGGTAKFHWDE